MRKCWCGCGEKASGKLLFRLGHCARMTKERKLEFKSFYYNHWKLKNFKKFDGFCKCGCGEKTPSYKRKWEHFSMIQHLAFVPGHQWKHCKNRIRPFFRYSHRSAMITGVKNLYGLACANCGWDKTRIDIAHLSKGMKLVNVVPLCPNCHRLLDSGILPKNPLFEFQKRCLSSQTHFSKSL